MPQYWHYVHVTTDPRNDEGLDRERGTGEAEGVP